MGVRSGGRGVSPMQRRPVIGRGAGLGGAADQWLVAVSREAGSRSAAVPQ